MLYNAVIARYNAVVPVAPGNSTTPAISPFLGLLRGYVEGLLFSLFRYAFTRDSG